MVAGWINAIGTDNVGLQILQIWYVTSADCGVSKRVDIDGLDTAGSQILCDTAELIVRWNLWSRISFYSEGIKR